MIFIDEESNLVMTVRSQEAILEVPPPVLRIVPTSSVLPHEEYDAQRSMPLVKRIEESGIWLHPPLVTPLPDSNELYVVLDGANRCHAMQALGYPHILVQVVDYESGQVALDTWNHVVADLSAQEILAGIDALDHVHITRSDLLSARAALAKRQALAYIIDFTDNQAGYIVTSDDYDIRLRTKQLRAVVDVYKERSMLERINTAHPDNVAQMFPDVTALVVFPHYDPSEILLAAREQILLPPGISRHIIQGRAMRLLYPLERLFDPDTSLADKNRTLEQWITERTQQRAVRFYAEAIYTFDD